MRSEKHLWRRRKKQHLQRRVPVRTGKSQSLWDFARPNSKQILPWRGAGRLSIFMHHLPFYVSAYLFQF
jgi:hypothetical protein